MIISNVIILFLICLLALQVVYFIAIVIPFLQHKDSFNHDNPQINPINILIIMKNELHNIHGLLNSLFQQINVPYEVFLVDDHSTEEQIHEIVKLIPNSTPIKIINSKGSPGKKQALRHSILLLDENIIVIDADCRPNSKLWAKNMSDLLINHDVIIGYGPFFRTNGFLNKLIRFDTMWIASQYFGWSQKNLPYMAVGRNMAFKKSIFEKYKDEFKGNHLISGDDDMFIQAISSKAKTGISTSKNTFVYSACADTYSAYLKQKSRHISTSAHYKWIHKIALFSDHFVKILFYPTLLISAFFIDPLWTILLLTLKVIISYTINFACSMKLDEKDLIYISPLLEFVYGIHLIILALYSLFSNKKVWK